MFMNVIAILLFIVAIVAFTRVFRSHGWSSIGLFLVVLVLGSLALLAAHITTFGVF